MCALHNNGYNVSKAIASLVPSGGPILCRDGQQVGVSEHSLSVHNLLTAPYTFFRVL